MSASAINMLTSVPRSPGLIAKLGTWRLAAARNEAEIAATAAADVMDACILATAFAVAAKDTTPISAGDMGSAADNVAASCAFSASFACSVATAPGNIKLTPKDALILATNAASGAACIMGAINGFKASNSATKPGRLALMLETATDSRAEALAASGLVPRLAAIFATAFAVAERLTKAVALIAGTGRPACTMA